MYRISFFTRIANNRMRLILTVLLIELLISCGAVTWDTIRLSPSIEQEARSLKPSEQEALVYVIREGKFYGKGVLTGIDFNNHHLALQGDNSFSYFRFKPGTYTMNVNAVSAIHQNWFSAPNSGGFAINSWNYKAHEEVVQWPDSLSIIKAIEHGPFFGTLDFSVEKGKTYYFKYNFKEAISIQPVTEVVGRQMVTAGKLSKTTFEMSCPSLKNNFKSCKLKAIEGVRLLKKKKKKTGKNL